MKRAALLAAASTAMLGSFAQADTVTFSATVPMTKTDWTSVISLPKFDASLGTLLSVQFSLSGTNQTVTRVENRDAIRWRVTTGSDVALGAQSPTLNLVSVAPSIRYTNNLQAFDGIIDYAGTSGITNPQLTSSAAQTATDVVGVDDVSDFVGAGNVPITVRAVGTGFYSGPGDYSFEVITDAAAEATVVYEYAPPVEDPLGSIGDRVWHDDNQDGIQDSGELGLEGWTVTLFNDAGVQIRQMLTGPDGLYLFTDLPAGQYRVTVTPQPDWLQTFDIDGVSSAHTALASLAAGEDRRDVDFGYDRVPLGSIGDRVWKDIDADGVQDSGEVGLVGWRVTLIRDGTVLGSTNTVADGFYLFENLPAGTYTVQVTRQSGYTQTFDLDGLLTPSVATATLGVGQHRRDVDFGYTCFTACPPAGCGCTPGFWSNRGLGLVRPTDLAVLTSLKLVDATGANADFLNPATYNFGGTGSASLSAARTRFSQWIGSQNAVNMAAQLSRHLAAFQLNIRYGFISSTRTYSYNGQTYTAVQLVQVANAELCKDQSTRPPVTRIARHKSA